MKLKQVEQNRKAFFLDDHFLGDSSQGGQNRLFVGVSGATASVGNVSPVEADRPGIARISSGTAVGNNAILRLSNGIYLGNNSNWEFNASFKINTVLPTSTENYVIRIGLTNATNGYTIPTNAIYMSYSSGNPEFMWLCINNTTQSSIYSGVTPVSGSWYDMKISVNPTNAILIMNGVSKTLTDMPRVLGREVGLTLSNGKAAGTVINGQVDIDYYSLSGQLV